MKALVTETFTPPNQDDSKTKKSYKIKPLSSWQMTELLADGSDDLRANKGFKFRDVKFLLTNGLEDPKIIETMPSEHHALVAAEIYKKALLREEEIKNS